MSNVSSTNKALTIGHPQIEDVKLRIQAIVSSNLPSEHLSEFTRYKNKDLLFACLVLWSADLGAGVNEMSVDLAVAVELIYSSAMSHITCPSANNPKEAVFIGDLLQIEGLSLLCSYDPYVIRTVLETAKTLISGEYHESLSKIDVVKHEQKYLERIYYKMAAYTATCCKLGAVSSGASQKILEAITGFGFAFGMAQQIKIELFDFLKKNYRITEKVNLNPLELGEGLVGKENFPYGWKTFFKYFSKAERALQLIPANESKLELQKLLFSLRSAPNIEGDESSAIRKR